MRMFSSLPQLLMLTLLVLPMVMVSDRAMARAEEDELEHGEDEPGQQQTSDTVTMFSVKSNSSKLLPTSLDNKLRPAGESPGGR